MIDTVTRDAGKTLMNGRYCPRPIYEGRGSIFRSAFNEVGEPDLTSGLNDARAFLLLTDSRVEADTFRQTLNGMDMGTITSYARLTHIHVIDRETQAVVASGTVRGPRATAEHLMRYNSRDGGAADLSKVAKWVMTLPEEPPAEPVYVDNRILEIRDQLYSRSTELPLDVIVPFLTEFADHADTYPYAWTGKIVDLTLQDTRSEAVLAAIKVVGLHGMDSMRIRMLLAKLSSRESPEIQRALVAWCRDHRPHTEEDVQAIETIIDFSKDNAIRESAEDLLKYD